MEDSSRGFSDFGGGVEGKETPYDTAMREGGEELTGFLGGEPDIRKLVSKNGGVYPITVGTYYIHIFALDYDPNLPVYYNNNHRFLWDRMDKNVLNKTKLFEKIEIQWFSLADMKRRMSEFREFYQEMVQVFLKDASKIKKFIQAKQGHVKNASKSKTRKHGR